MQLKIFVKIWNKRWEIYFYFCNNLLLRMQLKIFVKIYDKKMRNLLLFSK